DAGLGDRLRRLERAVSVEEKAAVRSPGDGVRRADGAVRAAGDRYRAVVGEEGVGHLVGLGAAADHDVRRLADLDLVSVRAEVRRSRLGQARRGAGGVRYRKRAVHLPVGEHLAHAPPQDDGGADAAAGHARAVLVLRGDALPALLRAAHRARPPRGAAERARRALSRARGLMMIRRLLIGMW